MTDSWIFHQKVDFRKTDIKANQKETFYNFLEKYSVGFSLYDKRETCSKLKSSLNWKKLNSIFVCLYAIKGEQKAVAKKKWIYLKTSVWLPKALQDIVPHCY